MLKNRVKIKTIHYPLLLLAIFLCHIAVNSYILNRSEIIRFGDENNRLLYGLSLSRLIFLNPGMDIAHKLNYLLSLKIGPGAGQVHPHLFEFAEAVSWRILDIGKIMNENSMILITNAIFLLILLISVYRIGSIIYNRGIGLLSAFLISFFPLVFGHSRVALLDYPLMCMVCLGFYLLLKTDGFKSLYFSIFSGIAFGLAQLTKESAIIFIFSPLIYYFIRSYSSGDKKKALLNFTVTLLFFIIISGSTYFRIDNAGLLKTYMDKMSINSAESYLYYLKNFMHFTGPFILFLSLPLLLNYLINFKKRDKFVFFWLFIPLMLLSISPNRYSRFLLPALPAFALLMAQELSADSISGKVKRAYGFILISCSLLQYVFFNTGFLSPKLNSNHYETGVLGIEKDEYFSVAPALLDVFKKETPAVHNLNKKIIFLFNIPKIHSPLQFKLQLSGLPYNFVCPLEADTVDVRMFRGINWQEEILRMDYIVDKTGYTGIFQHSEDIARELKAGLIKYRNTFRIIAEIKLSDGSSLYVYKKND